jgi:hypothetical protein
MNIFYFLFFRFSNIIPDITKNQLRNGTVIDKATAMLRMGESQVDYGASPQLRLRSHQMTSKDTLWTGKKLLGETLAGSRGPGEVIESSQLFDNRGLRDLLAESDPENGILGLL